MYKTENIPKPRDSSTGKDFHIRNKKRVKIDPNYDSSSDVASNHAKSTKSFFTKKTGMSTKSAPLVQKLENQTKLQPIGEQKRQIRTRKTKIRPSSSYSPQKDFNLTQNSSLKFLGSNEKKLFSKK